MTTPIKKLKPISSSLLSIVEQKLKEQNLAVTAGNIWVILDQLNYHNYKEQVDYILALIKISNTT